MVLLSRAVLRATRPDIEAEWEDFTARLTTVLRSLEEWQYLIISHKRGGYVQFTADETELYAEAMSLQYVLACELGEREELVAALFSEVGELGWAMPTELPPEDRPPGYVPTGSPNLSMQWDVPVPFGEAARCAVATLRRVYGAVRPGNLRYKAFARASRRAPNARPLGIPRER
jgi:hypothetical protein